jgi:choline dehydrogenase
MSFDTLRGDRAVRDRMIDALDVAADDASAVVDTRLRVRGVSGLRVVDASIMPTITSGNTNSPALMVAERGAEMIRVDRRSR